MKNHCYWRQEQEGRDAPIDAACPYGLSEIGARCAWLAGYRGRWYGQ